MLLLLDYRCVAVHLSCKLLTNNKYHYILGQSGDASESGSTTRLSPRSSPTPDRKSQVSSEGSPIVQRKQEMGVSFVICYRPSSAFIEDTITISGEM